MRRDEPRCVGAFASSFAIVVMIAASILGATGVEPAVAGQSADILFPIDSTDLVRVSPTGTWLAARGDHSRGQGVMVQRIGLPRVVPIDNYPAIRRMLWEGPDTLLVETIDRSNYLRVIVVTLSMVGDEIRFETTDLPSIGWLVDASPTRPGEVVWEYEYAGRNSIHRIELADLMAGAHAVRANGSVVSIGKRMAVVRGSISRWIVDGAGVPRAALRREEKGYSLLASGKAGRSLESLYRFEDDESSREIFPFGLSADGRRILVSAHGGSDFKALYELDPATGELGAEVYRRPDADVTGLLTDDLTREPVAVLYAAAGETRAHYFPAYRDRYLDKLDESWDRTSLRVVNGTADRKSFVFFRADASNPGEYFFRDSEGRIVRIAQVGVEIDRSTLARVESLRVKSKDGLEIEAFLAVPASSGAPDALVVMPHGGPIGVHDVREYDPVVQYLASWGFAVLQVNYRGSSGYGLEFEQRGKKQWARGIEDDIDAAVENVMARPEIDESRVCIIGGSYGGFSALASVIRHPRRYRCAVTINGVTDIPLLADSSDWADSKRALEFFEESIGDLKTERDALIAVSPAYHADEIDVPVQIIQGLEDRRVDPDHAYRLIRMLALHGKEWDAQFVAGAGHSFERKDALAVYRAVRRFLTTHLQPETTFRQDPESPREVRDPVEPGEWNRNWKGGT